MLHAIVKQKNFANAVAILLGFNSLLKAGHRATHCTECFSSNTRPLISYKERRGLLSAVRFISSSILDGDYVVQYILGYMGAESLDSGVVGQETSINA